MALEYPQFLYKHIPPIDILTLAIFFPTIYIDL